MKIHRNLRVTPGREVPLVDVYQPSQPNGKTVLYLHGGAWHLGDKSNSETACSELARRGYTTVATSYRLSGFDHMQVGSVFVVMLVMLSMLVLTARTAGHMLFALFCMFLVTTFMLIVWTYVPVELGPKHPAHIQDVARALRWTVEHTALYGGRPDQLYVMGHSAGGHLAALLCTNTYYLRAAGVNPQHVRGCIAVSGVYSDKRMVESPFGRHLLANAFGPGPNYLDAFPIYHVTPDSPPFLLLNGGMDIFLKRHTLDFHYTLRQNGVFSHTRYFSERTHWDIAKHWDVNPEVPDAIDEFTKECEEYHVQQPRDTSAFLTEEIDLSELRSNS